MNMKVYELLVAGDLIVFKRTFGIYKGNDSTSDTLGILHEGDVGIVLKTAPGETSYVLTHFGVGFIYRAKYDYMRVRT
jgi:hypothetical protein